MPITRMLSYALLFFGAATAGAALQPPTLPQQMRAITIDHYGGVEVLHEQLLPLPTVGSDEVLIAVHTAGVGPWDAGVRSGEINEKSAHFPLVLGTDGSGTVVKVGTAVHDLHVGEAVYSYSWANPKGGFYAEYVSVAAAKVAPIPRNIDMVQAGALATTGLTAVQGIDDALHIKQGQSLIIHGAQGGVGTIALQLAKRRGARVLATASGTDGIALVRRLGADVVIDGHSADLAAAAKAFAPGGADALLAFAGGPALEQLSSGLRDGGVLAYPSGVEPPPRADSRIKVLRYDAIPGVKEFARLNQAMESIKAEVPIAAEYPLAEVRQAHQRLAAGHLLGKVVLRIQGAAPSADGTSAATSGGSAAFRSAIKGPRSADRAPLPFSDAVRVGATLYISGTLGLDQKTDRAATDPREEATLMMDRIKATVEQAGYHMDDMVSMQVYCTDLALYDTFNSVYRSYFTQDFPARAFIGVKELLRGAHFEAMGIAARPAAN